MHDHRQILALAAAAIDFELNPAERAELDAALDTCSLCRRQASAIRATATILARPSDIGTPSRVRDVVIGAALRGGRRTPEWRPLLAASLALLVVLGGTAVLVGNLQPPASGAASPPASPAASAPIATAVAQASPTPTAAPPSQALPSVPAETRPPVASPPPVVDGPLAAGNIAAMVTDGRLVIRTQPGTGASSAIFKTRIYQGQRMLILDGPVEAGGYPWFRVRLGSIEGWVSAAGLDGRPWLAPVRNGRIAFVRDAGDGSGETIFTVGPDGTSDEAPLLADPSLIRYDQLAWSPDGRRLVFVATLADSLNGSSEIFVIDADGSNLVQLTHNEVNDHSPAWSPDSTRVAFREPVDGSDQLDSAVLVIGADGSAERVLGPGVDAVWSPDGQQLAMTVHDGGSTRIWMQAADGTNRRQVADVSVASTSSAWSPDGQFLVVGGSGVSVVEVSSGSVTPLSTEAAMGVTWSPGGTIAFSTSEFVSPRVFVIASDGSGLKPVSGDLSGAADPHWSPDGRRLLFTMSANGSRTALTDADGSGLTFVDGDVYVVAAGDTFSRIAVAHGLTVDALLAANPHIPDPDRIAIGDALVVPPIGGTVRSPAWQPLIP